MKFKTIIKTPEALQLAADEGVKITLPTLISWCKKFSIGHMVGGRWYVYQRRLELMIDSRLFAEREKLKKENKIH